MRNVPFVLTCVTVLLLLPPNANCAQEGDARSAVEDTWDVTRELLQRREYSIAIYYLQGLEDDAAYAEIAATLQSDIDAIAELQKLSDSVETGIKSLKENDEITDRNNKYFFQSYEEGIDGCSLLVKAETGQELSLKQRRLHSLTWLDLASRSGSPEADDFTAGIFLAFDKDADIEAARAKLDGASKAGQDVKIWVERADQMVVQSTNEQASQTSSEPMLGYWFIKMGKRRMAFAMEFHANGSGNSFVDKWEKVDDGSYRVEISRHGTASVIVIGDRLFGRFSTGDMFRGSR